MSNYKITDEKNLPESELELSIEVPHETLAHHRTKAIKKLASKISVDGFRAGHVPEHILIQKIGEPAILEEAAYDSIESVFPTIMDEKKLHVVGEPRVAISKLALNNPLAFTITVSIFPEITLPDYKKIAVALNLKKTEDVTVSEKEVEDFIENLRKSIAQSSAGENATDKKEALPEVNDEFVKKLGNFKSVDDFKSQIKENLAEEKKRKAHDKKRLALVEEILEKTKVVVPKALIESELAKMHARFHDDVARMGMTMEDYMKQIKKSEDDLRKDWRPDAEKRAKLQLVLSAIAKEEKVEVTEEAVNHDVKHLIEEYKTVDPVRAHDYVTMMLTNEKVFALLESQK
ncbi:MAG: trigger factor [Patescibacteria group bacterium]